jgi:hypothetical protein
MCAGPVDRRGHSVSESFDVEPIFRGPLVDRLFLLCEQIEQQRRKPAGFEEFRDLAVAAAETAAAAAVSEDDKAGGRPWDAEITLDEDSLPVCGRLQPG